MNTSTIKAGVAALLVVASVAIPLAVQFRLRGKSRDAQETWLRQAGELTQLTEENGRLSNSIAATDSRSLSGEQFQELLRLRGEVARLREQTNAIGLLQAENLRLETASSGPPPSRTLLSPAELIEALSTETLDAMKNISAALPAAMQAYAADHNGKQPKVFSELRKYFPMSGGRRMTGLYTFEFVRDEGPQAGDALILREFTVHTSGAGQHSRLYGFIDGTVLEVTPPNDEYNAYNAWEREHLKGPPPAR